MAATGKRCGCGASNLLNCKGVSMNVAITGSRTIKAIDLHGVMPSETTAIISGGARGVDAIAEAYARHHGIKSIIHYPDYDRFGRGAPLKRNDLIVDDADLVIAFWNGRSRGTLYTINKAREKGKPVQIIRCEG